jgi:hypothetical protein
MTGRPTWRDLLAAVIIITFLIVSFWLDVPASTGEL